MLWTNRTLAITRGEQSWLWAIGEVSSSPTFGSESVPPTLANHTPHSNHPRPLARLLVVVPNNCSSYSLAGEVDRGGSFHEMEGPDRFRLCESDWSEHAKPMRPSMATYARMPKKSYSHGRPVESETRNASRGICSHLANFLFEKSPSKLREHAG